jgi:hypothetical protein
MRPRDRHRQAAGAPVSVTVDERPLYHQFAWAYERLFDDDAVPFIDTVVEVLANKGITAGARVLDAGFGTGRYLF